MRVGVYTVALATQCLVLWWSWGWILALRQGQSSAMTVAAQLLLAFVWLGWSIRTLRRWRRPERSVVLRWSPGVPSPHEHWRVQGWTDRPVCPEVVFQLQGWLLLRLSQSLPEGRVSRRAWCWVPPLSSRVDPQDIHRLHGLLTLKLGHPGVSPRAVASSVLPPDVKVPVSTRSLPATAPESEFADTVFADTVWMSEPVGSVSSPVRSSERAA